MHRSDSLSEGGRRSEGRGKSGKGERSEKKKRGGWEKKREEGGRRRERRVGEEERGGWEKIRRAELIASSDRSQYIDLHVVE